MCILRVQLVHTWMHFFITANYNEFSFDGFFEKGKTKTIRTICHSIDFIFPFFFAAAIEPYFFFTDAFQQCFFCIIVYVLRIELLPFGGGDLLRQLHSIGCLYSAHSMRRN